MKRVTLYISTVQYQAFQALAAQQGRTYSELVRDALDRYLGEGAKKTPRSRGRARKRG